MGECGSSVYLPATLEEGLPILNETRFPSCIRCIALILQSRVLRST